MYISYIHISIYISNFQNFKNNVLNVDYFMKIDIINLIWIMKGEKKQEKKEEKFVFS